jgi:hypothetical protein
MRDPFHNFLSKKQDGLSFGKVDTATNPLVSGLGLRLRFTLEQSLLQYETLESVSTAAVVE